MNLYLYERRFLIIISLCSIFGFLGFLYPNIAEAETGTIYRYNVKGIVVALPKLESKYPSIKIKHEEIPDYTDETGKKVGMSAMTMPFSVDGSVDISNLKPGDKIDFVFESWWQPKPGDRIVEIKKIE